MKPFDPSLTALLKRIYSHPNGYIDGDKRHCHRIPDTVTAEERQQLADAHSMPNQFVSMEHDACISRLQALAGAVELQRAADAFVASLVSSTPAWATVLPAMALGLTLPAHTASRVAPDRVCNLCFHTDASKDRAQQSYFHQISGSAWGENDPLDAVLALENATAIAADLWPVPSERDTWVFHQLLELLRGLPAAARYSKAREAIKASGLLAVNTPARCETLLAALAFIGVLETPEHPGLFTRFTSSSERDMRPNVRVEVPGPLAWWSSDHGLNEALLERLFGHLPVPAHEPAAPAKVKAPKAAKAPSSGPKAISGPVAAGDIYAVRYREDLWGAVYCHAEETDARGITRGRVEYLDLLSPTTPSAEQVRGLAYRDRLNGERCQHWSAGLAKTTGVKRIAVGQPAPVHQQPTPTRISFAGAKELGHLASWHFRFKE
ncbi:MAG: hypothetical protein ABWY06_12765 [Pseudomonas sp.]|uniref:hypothetical protein n=1 Tax=Pseudomonas sp. TaxID=306 RepID=UPI003396F91B